MDNNEGLQSSITRIQNFLEVLISDVTDANNEIERSDSPYRRRVYVRAVFAHI